MCMINRKDRYGAWDVVSRLKVNITYMYGVIHLALLILENSEVLENKFRLSHGKSNLENKLGVSFTVFKFLSFWIAALEQYSI